MPVIMECLKAIGVDAVGVDDYEAEDVIASMLDQIDPPIEIVSGDRDLFSLIRDPDILVLYPEKAGLSVITEAEVERRYGVPGRAYGDFAILRGDPSDGLPGVAGIGPKKAADLVKRYGSVRGMLDADIFRAEDAAYLERALLVVPPVRNLKFKLPKGTRKKWPDEPEMVEKLGNAFGITGSFDRLLKALRNR
jgi:5'-3' exonuclease